MEDTIASSPGLASKIVSPLYGHNNRSNLDSEVSQHI
jgi:hypothetical protein